MSQSFYPNYFYIQGVPNNLTPTHFQPTISNILERARVEGGQVKPSRIVQSPVLHPVEDKTIDFHPECFYIRLVPTAVEIHLPNSRIPEDVSQRISGPIPREQRVRFYPLGIGPLILWESDYLSSGIRNILLETGHGKRDTLSSGNRTTYTLGNILWESGIWEMRYNPYSQSFVKILPKSRLPEGIFFPPRAMDGLPAPVSRYFTMII